MELAEDFVMLVMLSLYYRSLLMVVHLGKVGVFNKSFQFFWKKNLSFLYV